MEYLLLIAGLAILISGAELLVKGAVGIALRFRVSMLVIGMTIVSFGTSAPELLVSIKAALNGHEDIGVGTIVGSNISNIALILGFTALLMPIKVQDDTLRIDWPMMMLATVGFYLVVLDNLLSFWEGLAFVLILFGFGYWLIRRSRAKEAEHITKEEVKTKLSSFNNLLRFFFFILAGAVGLVYGSDLLLDSAVQIARNFNVSERVIGVTIIAFGTSVPELITSVVAVFRKKTDISIGNLIGSNLFNLLAILGITSMIRPVHIDETILDFDLVWLIAISLLLFPLMFFGLKISRWKGLFLFLAYLTYIYFVIK